MPLLLSLLLTTMTFGVPSTSREHTENERQVAEARAVIQETTLEVMHLAGRYFARTPVTVYELDLSAATAAPVKIQGLMEVWTLAESGQGKVLAIGRANGTPRLMLDVFGDVSDLPLPNGLAPPFGRITLAAGKTAVAVATREQVFWWNGTQWSKTSLVHALPNVREEASVRPYFVANTLFISVDEGEWGAGIFAVQQGTQKLTRVCEVPSKTSLLHLANWLVSDERALLMESSLGTARLSSLTPQGQCRTLAILETNSNRPADDELEVPPVTGMDLDASKKWVVLSAFSGLFHQKKGQWRPMVPELGDPTARFGFSGSSNTYLSDLPVTFTALKLSGDIAIIGTNHVGVLLVDMKSGQIRRVTLPPSKEFP